MPQRANIFLSHCKTYARKEERHKEQMEKMSEFSQKARVGTEIKKDGKKNKSTRKGASARQQQYQHSGDESQAVEKAVHSIVHIERIMYPGMFSQMPEDRITFQCRLIAFGYKKRGSCHGNAPGGKVGGYSLHNFFKQCSAAAYIFRIKPVRDLTLFMSLSESNHSRNYGPVIIKISEIIIGIAKPDDLFGCLRNTCKQRVERAYRTGSAQLPHGIRYQQNSEQQDACCCNTAQKSLFSTRTDKEKHDRRYGGKDKQVFPEPPADTDDSAKGGGERKKSERRVLSFQNVCKQEQYSQKKWEFSVVTQFRNHNQERR